MNTKDITEKQLEDFDDVFEVPKELKPYVNDYPINIFEIAYLSEEQIGRFQSDFKLAAEFFVNKRKDPEDIPDSTETIRHVDEFLKILSSVTKDEQYEAVLRSEGKKVKTMCEAADRLIRKGIAEGIAEGRGELLIQQVFKKLQKQKNEKQIAEELEEEESVIEKICKAIQACGNTEDWNQIYRVWKQEIL